MAKELETLIVVSKVKDVIKEHEMRSGEDFIAALSEMNHKVIKAAVDRAKANGRATLKAEDI